MCTIAGAVLGRNEVGGQHLKTVGRVHEIRERRQVPRAEQVRTAIGGEDLGLFAEFPRVRRQARLRQHVAPLPRLHEHVLHVGVDRHRLVGRQRPRRRRPDQQIGAIELTAHARSRWGCAGHLEPDRDRRVLTALVDVVVHPQFVAGQRGLVVPAVRQHAITLVGQALVPQLLERPDHRLHEAEIQCLVAILEVDPPRLAGDVGLPLVRVAQHRRAAGIVELLDAHLFDLRLVGDAELPLNFEFRGQPVRVPAEAAFHLVTAHGAIPRHDVLDVAGQQVAVVRQAVRERRPVIEHVFRRTVAARDAGAEGVVTVPVTQDVGFERREVRRAACRLRISGHGRASSPVPMSLALRSGSPAVVQARGRRRAGARTPRYHPACARVCAAHLVAVTGLPVRVY